MTNPGHHGQGRGPVPPYGQPQDPYSVLPGQANQPPYGPPAGSVPPFPSPPPISGPPVSGPPPGYPPTASYPPIPPTGPKKKVGKTGLIIGIVAAVLILCCGGLTLIGALVGNPTPAAKTAAATERSPSPSSPGSPTASAPATMPVAAPPASTAPVATTTPPAPPAVHTTGPAAKPTTRAPTTKAATQPPAAPVDLCGAPANPYGYNFCGGSTITNPPSDICNYLSCIGNFWNGRGYIEQCQDGMFSKSGGIQGSCSSHGGNRRPLYSH